MVCGQPIAKQEFKSLIRIAADVAADYDKTVGRVNDGFTSLMS